MLEEKERLGVSTCFYFWKGPEQSASNWDVSRYEKPLQKSFFEPHSGR